MGHVTQTQVKKIKRQAKKSENGVFCTHPHPVAPLFWWKERGKQELSCTYSRSETRTTKRTSLVTHLMTMPKAAGKNSDHLIAIFSNYCYPRNKILLGSEHSLLIG